MSATAAEIRRWARAAGIAVGERGRLSPDLVAAYQRTVAAGAGGNAAGPGGDAVGGDGPRASATAPPRSRSASAAVKVVRAKERWDWQRSDG